MPIVSTELTEVAPKDPEAIAVVGDYIVSIGRNSTTTGLMPNGSFAVMDTNSETALAYGGLSTSNTSRERILSAVGASGKAWAFGETMTGVYEIDPATGGVTSHSLSISALSGSLVYVSAAAGWIVAISAGFTTARGYKMSDGSTATFTVPSAVNATASYNGLVYLWSNSGTAGWRTLDPTTGTVSSVVADSNSPFGRGVESGGSLWFQKLTGVIEVDPTTLAVVATYSHGFATDFSADTDLISHDDGWLYGYGASDYLIGFDPVTHSFGHEALSPTRGHRYTVVSCNGKLWIPSGEPLT